MVPPMPSWVNSASVPVAVRSPSASPQAPPADPDAPLNLTKPKHSPRTEHGLPAHHMTESPLGPLAATAPKLLPPGLVMPRAFLHYAGLPPHVNPTGANYTNITNFNVN